MLRSFNVVPSNFIRSCNRQCIKVNYFCTKSTTVDSKEKTEDDTPVVLVEDLEDPEERRLRIDKIRNKCSLRPEHRRLLNDEVPFDEPQSWVHTTIRYQRTMLGRYGLKSGVDPRICFPTQAERADKEEWERVAFPKTLQEMMEINRQEKAAKIDAIRRREEDIDKKISKLDVWISDLNVRVAKKEAQALAAKEKKERLVEEVRRQFGFALDPRDEKFKELLAQKEKEEKKKEKELKRKLKEAKLLEKLVATGKASEAAAAATSEPSATEGVAKPTQEAKTNQAEEEGTKK